MKRRPLSERVNALKTRKDKRYHSLRLRDDLAQLICSGIKLKGITQRELAVQTGYSESYVSRLVNAGTNFKIGVAARILVPLGIIPRLVAAADHDSRQSPQPIPTAESEPINVAAATVVYRTCGPTDILPENRGAADSSRPSNPVGRLHGAGNPYRAVVGTAEVLRGKPAFGTIRSGTAPNDPGASTRYCRLDLSGTESLARAPY